MFKGFKPFEFFPNPCSVLALALGALAALLCFADSWPPPSEVQDVFRSCKYTSAAEGARSMHETVLPEWWIVIPRFGGDTIGLCEPRWSGHAMSFAQPFDICGEISIALS